MPTGEPRTALQSMTRRRFVVTAWPWRSVGYLSTTPPVAMAAGLPLMLLVLPWIALLIWFFEGVRQSLGILVVLLVLGAGLLAAFGPLVALPVAVLERYRLRMVDSRPAGSGHRRPPAVGLWPWLRTRYTEAATWRALGYAILLVTVVPVAYLLAASVVLVIGVMMMSPALADEGQVVIGVGTISSAGEAVPYALAGLVLLPAIPYLLALLAGAHAALARALLAGGDREQLRAELVEVSRSRARLVDAFETERRRIERDLHDGAQRRLVSLTLQLGMARLDLSPGSPAAGAVADAHEQAKQTMAELRELIRGIHPKVLTDRGLPAALRELADDVAIPVAVRTDLGERLPSNLEATAYFVAAEALTNVTKHSGAAGASLTAHRQGELAVLEVVDNGRGGADPQRGTGLTGLADRVATVGGRMLLSSPPGGPTVVRVELPCHQPDPPCG